MMIILKQLTALQQVIAISNSIHIPEKVSETEYEYTDSDYEYTYTYKDTYQYPYDK